MTDRYTADVLVQDTRAQAPSSIVTPATYPMGRRPGGDSIELSARLDAIQSDLRAGNVKDAIRAAQIISGRAAREGDRRTASLLRKAVTMARFYVTEQAADLVGQAKAEAVALA
jgi:hypothetical protein